MNQMQLIRKDFRTCVSCNPNIDKIEIDGEMVNVLGEKRIGEWVFYIFSYNVKGGGLPF